MNKSVIELIGKTPLLELTKLEKELNLKARLAVKLEYLNPAGSMKDRAAYNMITDAEEKSLIKEGATIIEPTSGNTGIGLAMVSAIRGYKLILTMPDTMSKERINILKAYGADIVLTPGKLGMQGAVDKANELAKEYENSFIPDQFGNMANANAHYLTTGPEIMEQSDGEVDILVAGVGTGGSLTGIGSYLKDHKQGVKVVAVEPYDSPLLSEGKAGPHGIQGIGANFVPSILNKELIDEIIPVKTEDAIDTAKMLGKKEGILNGISSGAALWAAIKLADKEENEGKLIVAVLPDSGDRYYSTPIFESEN